MYIIFSLNSEITLLSFNKNSNFLSPYLIQSDVYTLINNIDIPSNPKNRNFVMIFEYLHEVKQKWNLYIYFSNSIIFILIKCKKIMNKRWMI